MCFFVYKKSAINLCDYLNINIKYKMHMYDPPNKNSFNSVEGIFGFNVNNKTNSWISDILRFFLNSSYVPANDFVV